MVFIVYTKTPSTDIFWKNNNVNIVGVYNNIYNASEFAYSYASNYIHKQSESGYKTRTEPNDIIVINKETIEIQTGYFTSSTNKKTTDIMSIHIIENEFSLNVTNVTNNIVINNVKTDDKHSINKKILMEELKEKLQLKFKFE